MPCLVRVALISTALIFGHSSSSHAANLSPEQIVIPAMEAKAWETTGAPAEFLNLPGFEHGIMRLKSGSALLRNTIFKNGTIDFDIRLNGHGILGLKFRRQPNGDAEAFFLRPQVNCATSEDCVQYMPYWNKAYEWDLYPEYQKAAPLNSNGWSHIRLVISGQRMRAFVNGTAALDVQRLAGPSNPGLISIGGPADYANLQIRPDSVDALSPKPVTTKRDGDPRFIRDWLVSPRFTLGNAIDAKTQVPIGQPLRFEPMTSSAKAWRFVTAEPKGLVNLSREVGSSPDPAAISAVWLKSDIISDRNQTKWIDFGWAREAWVYLNGKLIYADKNLYGIAGYSKTPDGRLALTNGRFALALRRGKNEIAVAIDDNFPGGSQHFGWGFEMRAHDMRGLHFTRPSK